MRTCLPPFLKKGIHKAWATQTPYRANVRVHTCRHAHTRSMDTHATRMHTNTHFSTTSLFAPYPLPLTLPHTHKIRLNYPGVLSPTRLLILLFLQKEHFFSPLLCSYNISLFLGFHTSAMPTGFLIFFFSLFLFIRLFYIVKDCVFWQGLAL